MSSPVATTSAADDAAPLAVAPRLDVVVVEQLQRIKQTVARVEETQAQIRQELAAGNAGTDVIPRMEATFARLTARARKCKDLLKACDALEQRCARLDASLRALEEQRAAKSPRP